MHHFAEMRKLCYQVVFELKEDTKIHSKLTLTIREKELY